MARRIDVIHAHGLVSSFVGVFWGKIFRKRVVSTTHSIYSFPAKGLYRSIVKMIFKNSNTVLTLSNQSKKEVERLGISHQEVKTFTYWIDLNKFSPSKNKIPLKKKLGIKNKFVVLFVGRLVKEKGIPILLEASSRWEKDTTLIIAGEGPMEQAVKEVSESTKDIKYVGRISQDELPDYYSLANLVIVPSQSEEGFGRVIMESLACGTPVLGTNMGGIPEAIDDSVGRLIPPTTNDIAKEVNYLKNKPTILGKLSKNARQFALRRYSEKNVETIISTYGK